MSRTRPRGEVVTPHSPRRLGGRYGDCPLPRPQADIAPSHLHETWPELKANTNQTHPPADSLEPTRSWLAHLVPRHPITTPSFSRVKPKMIVWFVSPQPTCSAAPRSSRQPIKLRPNPTCQDAAAPNPGRNLSGGSERGGGLATLFPECTLIASSRSMGRVAGDEGLL